jgi:sugar/nucleoside kinase (ribokinase family)
MARHYGIGCGRFSARQVLAGEARDLTDDDLRALFAAVNARFGLRAVAVTLRRAESAERHLWESAAGSADGAFARSPRPRPILLQDRLGGGDAWDGGFFYGLLTAGLEGAGLAKGVRVGDAATRLKQTLMFDLPILDRAELQALLNADASDTGATTVR